MLSTPVRDDLTTYAPVTNDDEDEDEGEGSMAERASTAAALRRISIAFRCLFSYDEVPRGRKGSARMCALHMAYYFVLLQSRCVLYWIAACLSVLLAH